MNQLMASWNMLKQMATPMAIRLTVRSGAWPNAACCEPPASPEPRLPNYCCCYEKSLSMTIGYSSAILEFIIYFNQI